MYIISIISESSKISYHFADATKLPGNSYDDKGNSNSN